MNIAVSPPMRRILALVLLLLLTLFVWSVAVRPVIELSTDRYADIEALSARLARLDAIIGRRAELEQRLRSQQNRLAAAGGLWHMASATAIGAAVQQRLHQAVAESGGRIDSSSEARETAEHGFVKVTVRFSIAGTLETLTRTLAAIEAARPALFADRVAVTAPDAPPADAPPPLRFDIDVSLYRARPQS